MWPPGRATMSATALAPRPGLSDDLGPVIDDHEIVPLLRALGDSQGSILLDLALGGQITIELPDDGEPVFSRRGRRS
jgi:hypothetical protein